MKSYTGLKQSRTLAKILSHDTADQTWERIVIAGANLDVPEKLQYRHNGDMPFQIYSGIGFPCWSLAALLGVLDIKITIESGEIYQLNIEKYGTLWNVSYKELFNRANPIETEYTEDLVDACYEMIIKLKELKLL